MATVYDGIDAALAAWIARQPVFGFGVPRRQLVRESLDAVGRSRDGDRIAAYRDQQNATRLDGLPGLPSAVVAAGRRSSREDA
jgi:hypothetical protein